MTGMRETLERFQVILVIVGAGWLLAGCGSTAVGPGDLCPAGLACDDQDACTVDSCDPDLGCQHAPVDVASQCDDGNPCTTDSCDPDSGCVQDGTGVTDTCDDGDPCTSDDVCQADAAGSCAGTPVPASACEDGNPCTLDRCDPGVGCVSDGTGMLDACDDGNACTRDDACQGDVDGTCTGVDTSAECDDGDPCTRDACDPLAGCQHSVAAGAACDDGNPCTAGDLCLPDGSCAGSSPTDCDDGSVCTADSCDPATGCVHDGTGIVGACDDRNVCTDNDVCRGDAAGTCAGTFRPLSECDDDNVCTVDTCHPQQGCVHDGSGIVRACSDGNACTAGDLCLGDAAGTCRGDQPVGCDDGNSCTADSCEPATGCVHDGTGNLDPCDDGSLCTDSDACQGDAAGTCAGVDISAQLCGDGNDCTADVCDPVAGCSNELIPSHACYPQIVVSYPPRGATIQGQLANPQVVITGQVTSGAGPITSFTLNGVDVPLAADGSFSQPVAAVVGGNTLVFEATDGMGSWRDRVQAFLWSSDYRKPDIAVPKSGMVDQGMGIWLSQGILDDGDHSLPPDDFATIFEMVLGGIDPGSFFDPNTPIASEAGYNIYLRSLAFGATRANLLAIAGGMRVTATLSNITGNLFFDCPCGFPCGCWWTGGDSTGGLSMSSLVVDANILLSVRPDHSLLVTVSNPTTSINNLDIWSDDGWTNFLLGIVMTFIQDQLVAGLEAELNDQLVNALAPMLEDALGALAISQSFDLPRLDGSGGVITIDLLTDFAFTNFHPGGGALGLRTGGYASPSVPYDNLGAPQRVGCGAGGQQLVIPEAFPFELVLADDTLNELFYAAWKGGLLEFPIPPDMLGGIDPSQYGIENLSLTVSGMLAPTASDCVNGELKIFIGDLRLDAHFELGGLPVDIVVFASATMGLELAVANGEIAINITQIDGLESELNVVQDELIGLIPLIGDGFELLIADALMQALNGGQLATIPLPEMDLSSAVGLPPGSAVIALDPQDLSRQAGNTVIGGDLR
jgi:hypothetical protein